LPPATPLRPNFASADRHLAGSCHSCPWSSRSRFRGPVVSLWVNQLYSHILSDAPDEQTAIFATASLWISGTCEFRVTRQCRDESVSSAGLRHRERGMFDGKVLRRTRSVVCSRLAGSPPSSAFTRRHFSLFSRGWRIRAVGSILAFRA
jgi:hypothetical protein